MFDLIVERKKKNAAYQAPTQSQTRAVHPNATRYRLSLVLLLCTSIDYISYMNCIEQASKQPVERQRYSTTNSSTTHSDIQDILQAIYSHNRKKKN